mgnify:CR=1 FL=1|jgi:hypothetical protein
MAWYYGTYKCGHDGRVQVIGPVKNRQWKADRHFEGFCPECWEVEKKRRFEEENRKAAAEAVELGLPELTGTEKQVAWANTLRQNWINENQEKIAYYEKQLGRNIISKYPEKVAKLKNSILGMKTAVETRLLAEASARFWIDNRYETVSAFLEAAGEKALSAPEVPPVEVPLEVQRQAIEDMTIRPEVPVTSLVTEIRVQDDMVTAKLPELIEDFRVILRNLRFDWSYSKSRWERKTGEITGSAINRAAELGIKLLAAGFPVRIYNDELQRKILASEYEPECVRWVMIHEKGFRIYWRREEDFYDESKRLPGARWISTKKSMYVPRDAFRELQDFAALYAFKFTALAQSRLVEAQQAFEAAMIADVIIPKKEQLPQPGKRPVLNPQEACGVDESLLD